MRVRVCMIRGPEPSPSLVLPAESRHRRLFLSGALQQAFEKDVGLNKRQLRKQVMQPIHNVMVHAARSSLSHPAASAYTSRERCSTVGPLGAMVIMVLPRERASTNGTPAVYASGVFDPLVLACAERMSYQGLASRRSRICSPTMRTHTSLPAICQGAACCWLPMPT